MNEGCNGKNVKELLQRERRRTCHAYTRLTLILTSSLYPRQRKYLCLTATNIDSFIKVFATYTFRVDAFTHCS